jgi:hypothetical protein
MSAHKNPSVKIR